MKRPLRATRASLVAVATRRSIPALSVLLGNPMKRTGNEAVDDLVAWKDFDEHVEILDEALSKHH